MKKQWVSIKCGLVRDAKHRIAMGEAVWLFMYMLDITDWDTGSILEWKDEAAAEEMQMPVRTLREQRRKLEAQDYIVCTQKQRSQTITIKNWTNPREYSGGVYNKKQGSSQASPSKNAQGYIQGDTQGSSQDVTPTSNSNIKDQIKDSASAQPVKISKPPKPPTPPEVRLYREVTSLYPPKPNFEAVVKIIQSVSFRLGRDCTVEDLKPFFAEWTFRGNRPTNLNWTSWAVTGIVPPQQYRKPSSNYENNMSILKSFAEKG